MVTGGDGEIVLLFDANCERWRLNGSSLFHVTVRLFSDHTLWWNSKCYEYEVWAPSAVPTIRTVDSRLERYPRKWT